MFARMRYKCEVKVSKFKLARPHKAQILEGIELTRESLGDCTKCACTFGNRSNSDVMLGSKCSITGANGLNIHCPVELH